MGNASIEVLDRGQPLSFTFEAMMSYHGPGSPGGVAHAFKVMERAFPLLDPAARLERREVGIRTAFGGPGARDGFELVTRAVTEDRFIVDRSLARSERGPTLERFVFCLGYRDRTVTLLVRQGFVPERLIVLVRMEDRTHAEDAELDELKQQMAEIVMAASAQDVYDLVEA